MSVLGAAAVTRGRLRRRSARKRDQRENEIAGRLKARARILFEAVLNDLVQRGRQHRADRDERRGLAVQYGADDVGRARARERALAAEHLVQNRAEREDIAAVIDGTAANLFRRHIADGADDEPRNGVDLSRREERVRRSSGDRLDELREAEVENLHAPIEGDEQILGLEIAVHDAGVVGDGEAVRDLNREVDRLAGM